MAVGELAFWLLPWTAAAWPSSFPCNVACMANQKPEGPFGNMGVPKFEAASNSSCAITTNIPTAGYDHGATYVVTVSSSVALMMKVALGRTVVNDGGWKTSSAHNWVATADASTIFRALCGAGGSVRKVWVANAVQFTFSGKRAAVTTVTTTTAAVPKGALQLTAGLTLQSNIVGDNVDIVVTSDRKTWVALGFANGGSVSMTGGGTGVDLFACTAFTTVRRFSMTTYQAPSGGADVVGSKCEWVNGKTTMTFQRTLAARRLTSSGRRLATVAVTPGTQQVVIWAFGADGSTGFAKHAASNRGGLKVDLLSLASSDAAKKSGEAHLYVHFIFMTLSWGALLPWGVALANRTRNVKGAPKGAWFKLHRRLQSLGWLVQLLGFFAAVWHVEANVGEHWRNGHTYFGLIVVALGTLQPLNAFVRPHAAEKGAPKPLKRFLWELVHKGGGYFAIFLGQVNIWLGVKLLSDQGYNTGVIALAVVCGLLGVVTVVCYFLLAIASPDNCLSRFCVAANGEATRPQEKGVATEINAGPGPEPIGSDHTYSKE